MSAGPSRQFAPSSTTMRTSVTLSNGAEMPLLGLGCWQSTGPDDSAVTNAVKTAILAGYRHVDTAYFYQNERGVGDGVRAAIATGQVSRDDLYIVSKLPAIAMHPDRVEKYLRKSLANFELPYIDQYLVHLPIGFKERSETDVYPIEDGQLLIDPGTDQLAVWRSMERMVKLGLTKSIGVSNFSAKQLLRLISNAEIRPVVHQVECNVYFQQHQMRETLKKMNIAIVAYAPFASPGLKQSCEGAQLPDLLGDPVVRLVADKHHKTPAQILLRFLVQQDIIVIPKSTNEQRIQQNGDIFSFQLDETDTKALESLDRGEEGRSFKFAEMCPGWAEHPESVF